MFTEEEMLAEKEEEMLAEKAQKAFQFCMIGKAMF